jgi:hypothetical protein
MADICKASILNSDLWDLFSVHKLSINMRIYGLLNNNQFSNDYISEQQNYAKMLLLIGEGSYDNALVIKVDDTHLYDENNVFLLSKNKILKSDDLNEFKTNEGLIAVKIPMLSYINDMEKAIDFVYPLQFNCIENLCDSAILCATNKSVNKWNEKIQSYNPEKAYEIKSEDSFDCVDDPHNILANMITTEVLNEYNVNNVPTHKLILKVNDICLITRAMMVDNLPSNARVKITKISHKLIWVLTIMEKHPRVVAIPKIRFKFRMEYGQSFTMMRTQFPLRLASAMSYNKSQSQTLLRTLVDCTEMLFAHGHLYVTSS